MFKMGLKLTLSSASWWFFISGKKEKEDDKGTDRKKIRDDSGVF
jgi:hypothetical protein